MHLVWKLDAAGMENGIINICNGLPRETYRSSICALAKEGNAESRIEPHVNLFHVPRLCGNDPSLPLRLARLCRRAKVDIVHTHLWGTLIEGALAARLARVPFIVHGEHGQLATKRRQILLQRYVWPRVDRVLAVSSALADRMSKVIGFDRQRIKVIPNGVDTTVFRPCAASREENRRQFRLPPQGVVLGMLARLVPFKDHASAIQCLSILLSKGRDVHLAIAGDGPLRQSLQRLAQDCGVAERVHFVGHISDRVSFLGAIDVFLSTSAYNEGMSNSILEAMSSGLPVVATNVAASSELLDNGRIGRLVPPKDIPSLAAAVDSLVARPEERARLGHAARMRVVNGYTIQSMIGAYAALYSSVWTRRPAV